MVGLRSWVACAALAAVLPVAALAQNVAVIVANRDYANLPDAAGADAGEALGNELARAGFEVLDLNGFTTRDIGDDVATIGQQLREADRILIYVAGHVVHTKRDAFLLGTDVERLDPFSVAVGGVSLGGLLDLAAKAPGAAVFAVADARASIRPESGVIEGFGPQEAPQGVTILTGPPGQLARFLTEEIVVPGRRIDRALREAPRRIDGRGFVGPVAFLPGAEAPDAPGFEDRYWQRVTEEDSAEAYRDYLDRFPTGTHSDAAEDRITELTESEDERAARRESELALSRADRRAVQEFLTVLGFDTRGIDGIFGPGTRSAITLFQADRGFDESGYLTANQVSLLRTRGGERLAEIEAEEARERAERERRDRAFWQDTGAGADEVALRAYLERYPDGIYADVATERLAAIAERKAQERNRQDRAAWETARDTGTEDAFDAYLEEFPDGAFAEEARMSLRQLESPERVIDLDAARLQEDSLVLAGSARRLVEIRLAQLGYQPGPTDGQFDARTRDAIARYQESRGMMPSGYLNQRTVARLVAEAVFR